jgi:hypothetical protein
MRRWFSSRRDVDGTTRHLINHSLGFNRRVESLCETARLRANCGSVGSVSLGGAPRWRAPTIAYSTLHPMHRLSRKNPLSDNQSVNRSSINYQQDSFW